MHCIIIIILHIGGDTVPIKNISVSIPTPIVPAGINVEIEKTSTNEPSNEDIRDFFLDEDDEIIKHYSRGSFKTAPTSWKHIFLYSLSTLSPSFFPKSSSVADNLQPRTLQHYL